MYPELAFATLDLTGSPTLGCTGTRTITDLLHGSFAHVWLAGRLPECDGQSGCSLEQPTDRVGGDDLGLEPKIRVHVEEMFDDPNILVVGSNKLVFDSPSLDSPTRVHTLEMAVTFEIAALMSEVSLAQPEESTVPESLFHPALLMPEDFRVVVEQPASVCLPAPPHAAADAAAAATLYGTPVLRSINADST